jgi:hypothetical protein
VSVVDAAGVGAMLGDGMHAERASEARSRISARARDDRIHFNWVIHPRFMQILLRDSR